MKIPQNLKRGCISFKGSLFKFYIFAKGVIFPCFSKIFKFDAAHNLTKYHGKCERLHGHTYKLVVTVKGKLDEQDMVIDFALLKDIVQKEVIDILDHAYLNDIIENPTAEKHCKVDLAKALR